jgi:hypothetical protein
VSAVIELPSLKEAVMRRPFLISVILAISLVVLLLGYGALVASSYSAGPWGMMGPQMMSGPGPWGGCGPGLMMHGYGPPWSASGDLKLSVDNVKTYLDRWISWQGNPRLKVGDVREKDADTIVADIVTKDNSLVQRFAINRHSGFFQNVEDQS